MDVIKHGAVIPVNTTADGRPLCPCACNEPMVETAPGQWACPVTQAALEQLRPAVDVLIASLERL